tara:strand:+ start:51 stop:470 length:420 start_codon:yes stop_codon:yes gene_type:complete
MRLIFILSLISLPFFEIWGLFKLGGLYGWWFFLYIVTMAILGWQLIQDEKTLVLARVMNMMTQGGNLFSVLLGSAKNLLAGVLFLFPGIITDLFGFILLMIPIQNSMNKASSPFSEKRKNNTDNSDDVIEGEYRREEDK